jgi:hypothetical protein
LSGLSDPIASIAAGFPTIEAMTTSVIVHNHEGWSELPRNPSIEQFHARSGQARRSGNRLLGATITDLTENAAQRLEHSPFDPSTPGPHTLSDNALRCRQALPEDPTVQIAMSAEGVLPRTRANGLGFDATRLTSRTAADSDNYIDPVVECLVLEALPTFPVRGAGGLRASTRLWFDRQSRVGAFAWPLWEPALNLAAVDALLDAFALTWGDFRSGRGRPRDLERLGVVAVFESVPYRPATSSDVTRGYSSRLAWTT